MWWRMPRARRRSGAELTNAHLCAAYHNGSLCESAPPFGGGSSGGSSADGGVGRIGCGGGGRSAASQGATGAPGPSYSSAREYFGEMRRLVLAEARAQVREGLRELSGAVARQPIRLVLQRVEGGGSAPGALSSLSFAAAAERGARRGKVGVKGRVSNYSSLVGVQNSFRLPVFFQTSQTHSSYMPPHSLQGTRDSEAALRPGGVFLLAPSPNTRQGQARSDTANGGSTPHTNGGSTRRTGGAENLLAIIDGRSSMAGALDKGE